MTLTAQSSASVQRWNRALRKFFGVYRTELACNSSLFIGDVSACERAGLLLTHIRTNAGRIVRESWADNTLGDGHCFLVRQKKGASSITQGGRTIELSTGDIVLLDSVGPCSISPHGLIEHISLTLPREETKAKLDGVSSVFGKVSVTCPSGRILHSMFDEIGNTVQSGVNLHGDQTAIVAACISLLGSALKEDDDDQLPWAEISGVSLRQYTEQIIEDMLGSPDLAPAMLADRLQISVRHLYRIFEEDGDSVCRYIQRSRLRRSANDLANPRLKNETITSIAYRWGFSDSAHFSRSFRKEFQRSPREYRLVALGMSS